MKKIISLVLFFLSGFASTGSAQTRTITVGSGIDYDVDTIQAGIDAANDTDTILVTPGEYVITEPITFRGKVITVKSEAGRDETTIRMGTPSDTKRGSVVVFENNETTASVLEGFTITGGTGSWVPSHNTWGGGGIYFNACSGTVRNCAIVQNRAEYCGGVLCAYLCSPTLMDCTIANNVVEKDGGGVFVWSGASLTLTNCTITGNSATETCGGIEAWDNSSITLINCVITENTAGNSSGGVFSGLNSSAIITNCNISENSAEVGGGGLNCYENSSATLTDCVIMKNSVGIAGGGIECTKSSINLTNCIIARNSSLSCGGGLSCHEPSSSVIVNNCSFWANAANQEGGGVGCFNGASETVTNSIFLGNTAAKGNEIFLEQSPTRFSVAYSNVAGGQADVRARGGSTLDWGAGNIDADPLFADPNNDDFHLKSQAGRWDPNSQSWVHDDVTSPCIDTGDPMSPIGLEPFPSGGFVNMGAYGGTPEASKSYFGEPICETIVAGDINGDGQVNRADLEIMELHWTDEEPLTLP